MTNGSSGLKSLVNRDSAANGAADGEFTHDRSPIKNLRVFVWSSFDEASIKRQASAMLEYLRKKTHSMLDEETYLRGLSYTLALKRTPFP